MKNEGEGNLNIAKSIYTLATLIKELYFYKDCVHKIIPNQYKKFNPKKGENPFFSFDEFKPNSEDYKKSKERMDEIIKEINKKKD
jgi:hypothetical protein